MTKRTLPKGIYYRNGRYIAQARANKKQIQLGTFPTLEEAVDALDKAIARALQGLDSVKKEEKYLERLKTYKDKTIPHPDDDKLVELFNLYIIVRGATAYPQWQRNASLPAIITLDLAKRFLAKRNVFVTSLEDFDTLYKKRLDALMEAWMKDYKIVGPGPRKNTLEVCCKGCGKLSLARIGELPIACDCGTSETVLYFGKASDGTLYVSIGPTRPDNVVGCLYVPRGGMVPLRVGEGFELSLEPAPAAEIDLDRVLDKPYVSKKLDFLNEKVEDKTDEDDLDAYTSLLESNMLDLDNDFDFDSPAEVDEVTRKMLEEDMAERSAGSASDAIKKAKKK